MGKTRLVEEFLGWAVLQGADVLRGRAFEAAGQLPYQPIVMALRARLKRENAPEDLLADVWLAELSRLLPELLERYPDLSEALVSVGNDQPLAAARLFEAVGDARAADILVSAHRRMQNQTATMVDEASRQVFWHNGPTNRALWREIANGEDWPPVAYALDVPARQA